MHQQIYNLSDEADHSRDDGDPCSRTHQVRSPGPTEAVPGMRQTRQLPYSVDALMHLLTSIRACDPRVTKVQIIDKKLPAAYLNALLHAIASHPGISKVQLCRTGATDAIGPALALCILRSSSLTCLDLRKNTLSDQTVRLVSQALIAAASAAAARQSRHVDNHGNQDDNDNEDSENDVEEEHVSVISRLNLEDNRISEHGMLTLCKALPKTQISYIRLGKNPCWTWSSVPSDRSNMTAWKAMLRLLIERHSPLKRLDIRKSGISMQHVAGLAAALVDPRCQLQALGLSDNLLDDHAVTILATALKHNKHLLTLDLQRNTQLGDAGASALVHALQTENHIFQRVKLRYTAVSPQVKAQLLDCLLMNAHGPELAKRTKQIIQERYSWLLLQRANSSSLLNHEESETSTLDDFVNDEHQPNSNGAKHSHSSSCPECVICYNPLETSALLLPCQHDNCCPECGERLHSCHMCRTPIVKVLPLSSRRSHYCS